MPLVLVKQIDKSTLSLNEFVYGIYFDDVHARSASPAIRWARGQHQMLSIVAYEKPLKPLLPETLARDKANLNADSQAVFDHLRQGSVVLLPIDDYDKAISDIERVNPEYAKLLATQTARWREF